ncbi:AAA family ATPase [Rhodococcus sp. NPDC058521]|uniref:AAA family ATPase n=1 Tax=Rhodococcus sp. NPDC058521 TaxID=3346536 RepID=UPI00365568F3
MARESMRLVSAQITNVLGTYDHQLAFGADDDFVIIYGPNGVGKTKFLEIIHALSRLDVRTLSKLPFSTATLEYSDGYSIVAKPVRGDGGTRALGKPHVSFELGMPKKKRRVSWIFKGDDNESWLVENTSWRPFDGEMWEDRTDGELVPLSELVRRFRGKSSNETPMPKEFEKYKEAALTYLIETQRLRIESDEYSSVARRRVRYGFGNSPNRKSSKIAEHAMKMRKLVNDAQTEHSRITQQLDRTFPNRVLGRASSGDLVDSDIRRRYIEQDEFRSRLGRVASVALEDALSLPDRELHDWELHLLSLYLDDANKKLAPFEVLLQKIELFEDIVNSRLLNKRLQVTADEGLTVVDVLQERAIELDSLSSGEQHEIILMFDLLFNVQKGSLVMIDEPEISLHVVWQLAFIPDVQRIADLSGFRFVVATHSPQIINDSWNRAVRLGPETAEFA